MSNDAFCREMQRSFVEGRFLDNCTIRVTLYNDGRPTHSAPETIDITCHSVVLAARSPYFAASMESGFSTSRSVNLTLPDEQAVRDLRLLLKLNYTGCYIADETGATLDYDTLLRLAVLGEAFEFTECLDQCMGFLEDGLVQGKIHWDDIPEKFHGHECVKALKGRATMAIGET